MMFVGQFHPLLVHLPIGFLLIGLVLYCWERIDNQKQFSAAIGPIFFLGAIAATFSCLTGFFLKNGGEYDLETLGKHQNSGIALALLSFFFWYLYTKNAAQTTKHFFSVALFLLIMVTGHYGGTLTHGSGFLSFQKQTEADVKQITNIEEAIVYKDIVNPILQKRCVSCHGPNKMKGGLRLDNEEQILKGGKNGMVLSSEPLLIKRILLPPDDEEHMPPKEKGQLTNDEIRLIRWWINEGANFNARVNQLQKDSEIQSILTKISSPTENNIETNALPEVAAADPTTIAQLKNAGAAVTPVSHQSNLIHVNLLNVNDSSLKFWELLAKLSPQLYTLKADHSFIKDEHIQYLKQAIQLRKISLKGSKITDAVFNTISQLKELQSLNISDTRVTNTGLMTLKENINLRYLYMLNVGDTSSKLNLTNIDITSRMYIVPTLESDTSIVVESNR